MSRGSVASFIKEYSKSRPTLAQEIENQRKSGAGLSTKSQVVDQSWRKCSKCKSAFYTLDVPRGHPEHGKIKCACNAPRTTEEAYKMRFERSGLKEPFLFADIHKTPSRAKGLEQARKMLERGWGWLTLWGGYGGGKSFLGAVTANEFMQEGKSAAFSVMPLLLEEMKRAFNPDNELDAGEIYAQCLEADILVLDEFDRFRATGWSEERFTTLFLSRYRDSNRKATIWITNFEPYSGSGALNGREWADAFYSRMSEWPVVYMADKDIRPRIGEARSK